MNKVQWNSSRKGLGVARVKAHAPQHSRLIVGRAPENRVVEFTPAELFGAMAQCSSRRNMDQNAAKAQVEACRLLIAQHVDESGRQFAVMSTFRGLKDYFRKAMTGLVGDGIAYLQMIQDGYRWVDHFENLSVTKSVSSGRTPDFVFSRSNDRFVALTEAKATKGTTRPAFDKAVGDGYIGQVEPHLGRAIGTSVATHGFAVGSWMTSDSTAEIFVHHTGECEPDEDKDDGGGEAARSDPSDVRFGSYCGVLTLLFGPDVGQAARRGDWKPSRQTFTTVDWLGRTWVVGENAIEPLKPVTDGELVFHRPWALPFLNGFALDLEIARRLFAYIEMEERASAIFDNIPEYDERIRTEAKNTGGAIFPDGFAVLGRAETLSNLAPSHPSPREDGGGNELENAELAEVILSQSVGRKEERRNVFEPEEQQTEAITQKAMIYLTNG